MITKCDRQFSTREGATSAYVEIDGSNTVKCSAVVCAQSDLPDQQFTLTRDDAGI